MRCRPARAALLERELQTLRPERVAALERHLATCRDCGAEARHGESVRDELRLLRGDVPVEIDVRFQVMTRIREMGRPPADEMPVRHWVLSAVAAVVCGVVILGALWDLLPGLAEPASNAIGVVAGFRGVVASLTASVASLLAIPFKLLGTLISSLSSLAPLLERLAPLGVALAALAMGSMSVTVVFFVGRDLRNRPLAPVQERA